MPDIVIQINECWQSGICTGQLSAIYTCLPTDESSLNIGPKRDVKAEFVVWTELEVYENSVLGMRIFTMYFCLAKFSTRSPSSRLNIF